MPSGNWRLGHTAHMPTESHDRHWGVTPDAQHLPSRHMPAVQSESSSQLLPARALHVPLTTTLDVEEQAVHAPVLAAQDAQPSLVALLAQHAPSRQRRDAHSLAAEQAAPAGEGRMHVPTAVPTMVEGHTRILNPRPLTKPSEEKYMKKRGPGARKGATGVDLPDAVNSRGASLPTPLYTNTCGARRWSRQRRGSNCECRARG